MHGWLPVEFVEFSKVMNNYEKTLKRINSFVYVHNIDIGRSGVTF